MSRQKSNKHSRQRPKLVVPFLKERSNRLKDDIAALRKYASRDSPSPSSLKKKAMRRLLLSLVFDKVSYKRFLIKYQKFVFLTLNADISNELSYVVRLFEKLSVNHGPVYAVKKFKQLHDVYIRIITSHSIPRIDNLATNQRGEPKLLGPLLRLAHGSFNDRRAGLSAILVIKLVKCWDPDYSLEAIKREGPIPQIGIDDVPKVGFYFERIINKLGDNVNGVNLRQLRSHYIKVLNETFPQRYREARLKKISKESALHLSARNGPNGPCLTTVVLDHGCLTSFKRESHPLYESIRHMAQITSNTDLKIVLDNFDEEPYLWSHSKGKLPVDSRLSIKDESWAKRRVFAICDYFSQSSLKGFHNYLFRWLEDQPEDGTFDQDRISELVRQWSTDPDPLMRTESADLTAATDSIPAEVQAEIVTQIAGEDFAKTWRKIACERNFKIPLSDDFITYTTGQPMGLLSSWAMLAVWHHVMVRTCLSYLSLKREASVPIYGVIGDDVAMRGPQLFHIYETLVNTVQGVGISKIKGFHSETLTSDNTIPDLQSDFNHVAELAKRIFCNGKEITVIPPDEVYTSFDDPIAFPDILQSIKKRGYPITIDHILSPALASLFRNKKLALTLASNPILPSALIEGLDRLDYDSSPWNTLPWYTPGFSVDNFKGIFTKILRERTVSVLLNVVMGFNKWMKLIMTDGETKVKSWSYTCESQALVLFLSVKGCIDVVESRLSPKETDKIFPKGSPINWKSLKDYLGSLQVIFEVSYLFKENEIPKEVNKRRFVNTVLLKALKEALQKARAEMKTSNSGSLST